MRGHAILHVSMMLLCVVISSCPRAVTGQCSGDFSETCSDVKLEGTSTLAAWCGDGQGSIQSSSLNLNQHITNNNGRLECSANNGAFSLSCQSASVDASGTLTADCLDTSGNLLQTQVNLNQCVTNVSGTLNWACEAA